MPVILQSLISLGINLTDTMMLGSFGEYQLSASSLATNIFVTYNMLCLGISFGAAVVTAQYWGRGDIKSFKAIATIMYRLIAILGIVFTLAGVLIPGTLLKIFTNDADIIDYGIKYFRFFAPSFIFSGLMVATTNIMRSARLVKIPLISSIISFFINIFFNWVFIFGKLGAPRMEIAGAAVGTLIARVFEFCFICGYFFFKDKQIGYRIKDLFSPCKAYIAEYLKFGLPVLGADSMMAAGGIVQGMIIGHLGAAFVAANTITGVLSNLAVIFVQGAANAASTVTGNTLGAGEVEKAYDQGKTFLIMGFLMGVVSGLFIILIRAPFLTFYNVSAETKDTAMQLMLCLGLMFPVQMYAFVITKGVLRGGGDTKFLMFAEAVFLWLVALPLAYVAGYILKLQPFWIFFCFKLEFLLRGILLLFRFRSKKWIRVMGKKEDTNAKALEE